jgi:hypothetical protein
MAKRYIAEQAAFWPASPIQPKALHERPLSQWPAELHPTERMHENGASALSDAELLALILGTSGAKNPVMLASELIVSFGGWRGLHQANISELAQHSGMNRQRAAQIKAALEVWRRMMLAWHPGAPADSFAHGCRSDAHRRDESS